MDVGVSEQNFVRSVGRVGLMLFNFDPRQGEVAGHLNEPHDIQDIHRVSDFIQEGENSKYPISF